LYVIPFFFLLIIRKKFIKNYTKFFFKILMRQLWSSGTSKLCCRQSRDKELHRTGELEKKVLELSAQPAKLPLATSQAFFYLAAASVKGPLRLLRTLDCPPCCHGRKA
jgi:hypothetical protein